ARLPQGTNPRSPTARGAYIRCHGEEGVKKNTSSALLGTAEGAAGTMHGTDAALFVINLCTSMAPIPVPGKTLPGLEVYRLYQVMRIEDGRTRYRLRLGFFSTKADADAALVRVRDA